MYYNVNNPFCSTNSNASQNSTTNNKDTNESYEKTSNSDYDDKIIKNQNKKIRKLELQINDLISEIDSIKSSIEK